MDSVDSTNARFQRIFFDSVVRGAEIMTEANRVVQDFNSSHPLMQKASKVEYGQEALSASTFYLGAAANSLQALQLATVGPKPSEAIATGNVTIHITINGTCGLLRQILESAAIAKWAVSSPTDEDLMSRGFSITWANAIESVKHSNSLTSPNLPRLKSDLNALIQDGRRLNLMVERPKSSLGWEPRYSMVDTSGLLRARKLPNDLIAHYRETLGPGSENAEWLYRWLSGMAHGLPWVIELTMQDEPAEIMTGFTKPNYFRLALSAFAGVELIEEVIKMMYREA